MSRTKPRQIESEHIVYDCGSCGAPAWQWCTSKSGRWAPVLHSDRFYQWKSYRPTDLAPRPTLGSTE